MGNVQGLRSLSELLLVGAVIVGGAIAFGLYEQFRNRELNTRLNQSEFQNEKAQIQNDVHSLPDDALRSELEQDVSGNGPSSKS